LPANFTEYNRIVDEIKPRVWVEKKYKLEDLTEELRGRNEEEQELIKQKIGRSVNGYPRYPRLAEEIDPEDKDKSFELANKTGNDVPYLAYNV